MRKKLPSLLRGDEGGIFGGLCVILNEVKNLKFSGVYAIIDTGLLRGDICKVTEDIIAGGARFVQLRAKEISAREFVKAGSLAAAICGRNNILFIVNDRVDIAIALNADGVHVGQEDIPVQTARKLMPGKKLLGLSVHSLEEAMAARAEKPDYIGVGPIFHTSTKSGLAPPVGTDLIRKIKTETDIPLVAIGGINEQNIRNVLQAGADAVAVCSAILVSDNIRAATEKLVSECNSV